MSDTVNWFDAPLAVVDVETTGLDPSEDRVIEIGIVHMCRGEVQDRYELLINPGRPVPAEAQKITGISEDDLKDAPPFADIAEEVNKRLSDRVFVAYNLDFDRAFVKNELERAGVTWTERDYIDPLIFARQLHRDQGSKRLGAVAARFNIDIGSAHRAGDDAVAAGKVLYAFAPQLPPTLRELTILQAQWRQSQENEMAGWRNRRETTIESTAGLAQVDRGNSLGPAYLYGDDTDPVRAMFTHLPDSGTRR